MGDKNLKYQVIKIVYSLKRKEFITQNRLHLKNIYHNAVITVHFHLSYGDKSGGIHNATHPGVIYLLF